MRQTINGVTYDTDRAVVIAQVTGNVGSPHWFSGRLYVTPRSRRWFIAGDGGPYSLFGQHVGGGTCASGSGIAPLSIDRVREILEAGDDECHRILDAYAEELGVVDADSLPVAV